MKVIFYAIMFFHIFVSSKISAQTYDDNIFWGWTRVQGSLDTDLIPDHIDQNLLGSLEYHYRLNEDSSQFQSMILRPMVGYKVNDISTLWIGYAYIEFDTPTGIQREQRAFQMVSYSKKLDNAPVVFMGNTRLEQRFFEDSEETAHRLRQMLRVSIDLFKINDNQFFTFVQNEYFLGLNRTDRISNPGFDQNRAVIGIGYRTQIGNTPMELQLGYMNNYNNRNQLTHGVNFGVVITIPNRKK
jgi:hypothetical protein